MSNNIVISVTPIHSAEGVIMYTAESLIDEQVIRCRGFFTTKRKAIEDLDKVLASLSRNAIAARAKVANYIKDVLVYKEMDSKP